MNKAELFAKLRRKAQRLQTATEAMELVNQFLDDQRSRLLPGVSLGTYIDQMPDMFSAALSLYLHALFARTNRTRRRLPQ